MRVNAAAGSDPALLGIYLNDHNAGAAAGLALFRRVCAAHRRTSAGPVLERLTAEVAEDQATLGDIMSALGVPVRQYKVIGGWVGEKLSRIKPNGRLLSRSPVSSLVELEALHIGVLGKAAGWRMLQRLAASDGRLDPEQLDALVARAQRQAGEIEQLRLTAGAEAFAR